MDVDDVAHELEPDDATTVQKLALDKTEKEIETDPKLKGVREHSIEIPVFSDIDEDDLEEKKKRYSFSHQDFGRGIITTPAAKMRRAARRGLSIYKK